MLYNFKQDYLSLTHHSKTIRTTIEYEVENQDMKTVKSSHSSIFFMFFFVAFTSIQVCLADSDNLQDTCPTAPLEKQTIFINGLPCKNQANNTPQDFKTTELSKAGARDKLGRSSMKIVNATIFPGLNTLGLSIGRIDLEVDGMVNLHIHPRATEMIFVDQGVMAASFLDSQNKLFQKFLKAGDVFVIPKGLFHTFMNRGSTAAIVYSVFNSQNPGFETLSAPMPSDAMLESVEKLKRKLASMSDSELDDGNDDLALTVLEIIYSSPFHVVS